MRPNSEPIRNVSETEGMIFDIHSLHMILITHIHRTYQFY